MSSLVLACASCEVGIVYMDLYKLAAQESPSDYCDAAWNSAGKYAQGLQDDNARLQSALILASGALSMVSPCAAPECQAAQIEWLEDAKTSADRALAKGPK